MAWARRSIPPHKVPGQRPGVSATSIQKTDFLHEERAGAREPLLTASSRRRRRCGKPMRPSRWTSMRAAAGLVALLVVLVLPASAGAVAQILPGQSGLGDLDARSGRVAPSAAAGQRSRTRATAEWNRYGTPASLLANRASSARPAAVTRPRSRAASSPRTASCSGSPPPTSTRSSWSTTRSSSAATATRCSSASASAACAAGHDGMITVGVGGGSVAYVSSSAAGCQDAPAAATLTPPRRGSRRRQRRPAASARRPRLDPHRRRLDAVRRQRPRHAAVPGIKDRDRPARAARRAPDLHAGRPRRVRDDRARRRRRRRARVPLVRRRAHRRGAAALQRGQAGRGRRERHRQLLRQHRRRRGRLRQPAPGPAAARSRSRVRRPRTSSSNDIVLAASAPTATPSRTSDRARARRPSTTRAGGRIADGTYHSSSARSPTRPCRASGRRLRLHAAATPSTPLRRAERPPATRRGTFFERRARRTTGTDTRVDGCYLSRRRLRLRGQEHRVPRPVGREPAHRHDHDTTREQRPTGEAWVSPLTPGAAASSRSRRPRVHRPVRQPVGNEQVRPDDELAVPGTGNDIRPR